MTGILVLFYLAIACLAVVAGMSPAPVRYLGWVALLFATVALLILLVPGARVGSLAPTDHVQPRWLGPSALPNEEGVSGLIGAAAAERRPLG